MVRLFLLIVFVLDLVFLAGSYLSAHGVCLISLFRRKSTTDNTIPLIVLLVVGAGLLLSLIARPQKNRSHSDWPNSPPD